jgi:hypothetical protein
MSAKDAFHEGLEDIKDLARKAIEWENERKRKLAEENIPRLVSLGLRESEAEAWLQNEPDFTPKHPLRRPRNKLTPYLSGGRQTEITQGISA